MRSRRLAFLVLTLALGLVPSAFAHRGEGHFRQDPPPRTFLSEFPGYFDTHLASPGKTVLEVPTGSLDYGLNENLTIGTSVLPVAVMAFSRDAYLFLFKARYRFYSSERLSSVLTGYLLPFYVASGVLGSTTYGSLAIVTSNTSLYLGSSSSLTFHLTAMRYSSTLLAELDLSGSDETVDIEGSADLSLIAPGIGFQHAFGDWFGISLQLLVPATSSMSVNDPGTETNTDLLQRSGIPLISRGLIELATGQRSVLSGGFLGVSTGKRAFRAIPTLSWTVRLR